MNLLTARLSVLAIFFVHGLVFSTWVSRIPAVQDALGLSTGRLGFALLGVAAGSIVSMPLAGWLVSRYGSRPVTAISSLVFAGALAPPAFAGSAFSLALALSLLGLAAGAMDVSMNAQGVLVERIARKPMMSGFHAAFSIGGMAGSAAGGFIARAGVGVQPHFIGAAVVYVALVAASIRGLLPAAEASSSPSPLRFNRSIAGLSALCFCFFLSEGAIADWSGLHLTRSLGAGPAQAAMGYAVFSFAMAAGRAAGEWLRARFSAVALVRGGSLLAAAGLAAALLVSSAPLALAGFTLVGFGCSVIVPITFAAAGHQESSGGSLATVVSAGYLGLFAGPPLIGMAAEAVTLRWALTLVVALSAVGAWLAPTVEKPERMG